MYMGGCSSVRRSAAHQGRSRRGGGCGGRTRRGGGAGGIRRPAAPLAAARTLGGRAAGARSASEHGSRRSNARALPFLSLSRDRRAAAALDATFSLSRPTRRRVRRHYSLSPALCLYLSTAQWRRRSLVKKHEHAGLSRLWPRRPARRHYSFFLSPALSLPLSRDAALSRDRRAAACDATRTHGRVAAARDATIPSLSRSLSPAQSRRCFLSLSRDETRTCPSHFCDKGATTAAVAMAAPPLSAQSC